MSIKYCGNNNNYPGLSTGSHSIGTNYECLKKGIGTGLNLPFDSTYKIPYAPIDNRKYYCGNSDTLPITGDYFAMGSPSICHRTGVGIGKSMTAKSTHDNYLLIIKKSIPYILFLVTISIIFLIFYFNYSKFTFITKISPTTGEIVIDWTKFIPYYVMSVLISGILIFYIYSKYQNKIN
jgi:hypothetical protein